MSLAQLEYFVAIAEEGSLAKACRRLHISQPPLTRQIKSLEEELGTKLFERSHRGMNLLPSGALFLNHAKKILEQIDAAVLEVRDSLSTSTPAPKSNQGQNEIV